MLKIGHRGAKGYKPENTLSAFKKALEIGVDMVELDVYRCKSGEIVVMHDEKVDRMTDGKGYIADLTLDELRTLTIHGGEKIPTLQEVLDCIDRKARINIELKSESAVKPVAKILQGNLEKGWQPDDFLISSFDHYLLKSFHALLPQIKLGAILVGIPIGYAEFAEKVNAYSVHISQEFINRTFVEDVHKRGMKAFAFNPNNPEKIERMKTLGVDGIFSDYPDLL